MAHEEGPEARQVLRRLGGAAHRLHEVGERVQVPADEADHEVVVVGVEAVAGETDVVAETCAAEGHPDAAVLHEDRVLLPAGQLLEGARAAEWIPDRPRQRGVEHAPAWALDEGLLEVLLVADRVGASEHRQLRLRVEQ